MPGIEVGVVFDFELNGEQKSEARTYRYATEDPEQVKANLATALEEIRTIVTTPAPETTPVVGLEAGVSAEV